MKAFGAVVVAFAISWGAAVPDAAATPVIPDTPAGKTLRAWLDAFDSGDAPRMKEFAERYKYPHPDELVPFHAQTGGFDDADPAVIHSFTLLAIPPGMTAADMRIDVDAATRTRIVDAIAAQLNDLYVYPALAKKMEQAIRAHLAHGDYDALATGPELGEQLTADLRAVSHDRHLAIQFVPKAPPEGQDEPSADDQARMKERLEKMNCGFEKAERLDGNIGYIKFDMFGPVDICGPKATAAFASLGDVDALVFDLRQNGGGQPDMVAFVASYQPEVKVPADQALETAKKLAAEKLAKKRKR